MPDREAIRELLMRKGHGRIADAVVVSLEPSLAIMLEAVESESEIPLGASKFGGCADLPTDVNAWPRQGEVEQRFLAQINLADAAAVWPDVPLPKSGLLSFFWCQEGDGWSGRAEGRPVGWKVMYSAARPGTLHRLPDPWAQCPARGDGLRRLLRRKPAPFRRGFAPCRAKFRPMWTISDDPGRPGIEYTDKESDAIFGHLVEDLNAAGLLSEGHRLLGAATPVQGSVQHEIEAYVLNPAKPDWDRAEATAHRWRLLFQVDSDDEPGFAFGDWGNLYFMMLADDLRAQRWDRVEV
ncbi:MAG TPA: YwqG family protein, partial [Arthrobacter sp.]|nr:YwqG family protein [Arthrobacter sp.]